MHWRDKSLVAALGIWLHYPNKDNYLSILSLLPLPTLISLNGLLCTMEPGLTWNLQPWWVRMSWSDHAWATSYVHLSLVLSLPPLSLDLCWSLIPFLALSPPAPSSITRMDPRSFHCLLHLAASCRCCRTWSERALPELGLCSASTLSTLVGQVHSCCSLTQWSKNQMQSFHFCFGLVQPRFSNFRSGRWWQNN